MFILHMRAMILHELRGSCPPPLVGTVLVSVRLRGHSGPLQRRDGSGKHRTGSKRNARLGRNAKSFNKQETTACKVMGLTCGHSTPSFI